MIIWSFIYLFIYCHRFTFPALEHECT